MGRTGDNAFLAIFGLVGIIVGLILPFKLGWVEVGGFLNQGGAISGSLPTAMFASVAAAFVCGLIGGILGMFVDALLKKS